MRVSLYRKKAQKLKITTILFLFLILLLPVVSFKFSFDMFVKYKFENLKDEYSSTLSFNRLNLTNIDDSMSLVNNKTNSLRLKLKRYTERMRQVENDIKSKSNFSKFIQLFDEFWVNQSKDEKLFLKKFEITSDLYEISYFEITGLSFPISQKVLQKLVQNMNFSTDFSNSDSSPRQYGNYRAFLNVAKVSIPSVSSRSKGEKK